MGVATRMLIRVVLLIIGAAGSLGDELDEGKDVIGVEILKRMEMYEAKLEEDAVRFAMLEKKIHQLEKDRLTDTVDCCSSEGVKNIMEDVERNTVHIDFINKKMNGLEDNVADLYGKVGSVQKTVENVNESLSEEIEKVQTIREIIWAVEGNIAELSLAEKELEDQVSRVDTNVEVLKTMSSV